MALKSKVSRSTCSKLWGIFCLEQKYRAIWFIEKKSKCVVSCSYWWIMYFIVFYWFIFMPSKMSLEFSICLKNMLIRFRKTVMLPVDQQIKLFDFFHENKTKLTTEFPCIRRVSYYLKVLNKKESFYEWQYFITRCSLLLLRSFIKTRPEPNLLKSMF